MDIAKDKNDNNNAEYLDGNRKKYAGKNIYNLLVLVRFNRKGIYDTLRFMIYDTLRCYTGERKTKSICNAV